MGTDVNYNDWWNNLSEDEQIWIMMKHGFESFNPKKVNQNQIKNLYELEH